MQIGVLGTGEVGRTLAQALAVRGHEVVIGTRDPDETMARPVGDATFADWIGQVEVRLATSTEAVAGADLVVNALAGTAAVEAVEAIGADHFDGVVLLDVANALDGSDGFPPRMAVSDTDSLAEQLQRALPGARVVKSLNTMNAAVMVDPGSVGDGDHTVFVSGDDVDAKDVVVGLLTELGWTDVLDLGGLATARGVEQVLPLWLRIMGAVDSPRFQLKVVRPS